MKIDLGEISVDVFKKDIKNVHLSVHPPTGKVRISAPHRMSLDTIRVFAISKLAWIKQQQQKLREQEREPPREYTDRESHFVWGRRYLLKVIEREAAPTLELSHSKMTLQIRRASSLEKKQAVVDEWYRQQLRGEVPDLIAKWERLMGVKVQKIFVQKMKTKWGSCNPSAKHIRLNTDLAKKPRECLVEYMSGAFDDAPLQESFYVVCLNRKHRPICRNRVTLGTATSTLAHPREVFRIAILASAAGIVCVHNHPSGDPSPSSADVEVTRQLNEASKIIGIELLDHIVIGHHDDDPSGRGYYSFRDAGLI
jgi:DNA repair protein RadC